MAQTPERRGPDRRGRPRGGRRASDRPGFAPLVLVIDPDPHARNTSEAILAKLHFAVAPVESVEKAVTVMAALRPEIIVASESDIDSLRRRGIAAPFVITYQGQDADTLVEDIRRALREAQDGE